MATPLFHSVRFASANVCYPLPVAGPAHWGAEREPVRIPLPDVPADHVIAASFSSSLARGTFSFRLAFGGSAARAETARFGAGARRSQRGAHESVSVPVDYFHTRAPLTNPVLSLRHSQPAPPTYLLCVAIRPYVVEPPTQVPEATAIAPASQLSQTTLAVADRPRACSPTATAMALGIADGAALHTFVDLARHRPTGMLGVWPQNIWAAARFGRLGAVELISDWQTVRRVLNGGQRDASPPRLVGARAPAMVASVAFGPGGLPGSPLQESGGHLVTVRGIDRGSVVAHDPAAPPRQVARRYDAVRFAAAWMRRRGASYVFAGDSRAAPGSED